METTRTLPRRETAFARLSTHASFAAAFSSRFAITFQ